MKKVFVIATLFLICKGISSSPINLLPDDNNFFENVFRNIRSIMEDHPFFDDAGPENITTEKSQNIFETNQIIELPNGAEKIEKLVEKQSKDGTGNSTMDKKLIEFFKFPNHTFRKIERDGKDLTTREESEIGCVNNIDCNSTSFCDQRSYSCKSCSAKSTKCSQSEQCCPGLKCDEESGTCQKLKGFTGEQCGSMSDCTDGHCCSLDYNGNGVCQPYLEEDEDCGKDLFANPFPSSRALQQAGLPNKCPCHPGLKCERKQSLMFLEEVCTKPTTKPKKNAKLLKISIRKLPSLTFHTEADFDALPIPGLLPFGIASKIMNKRIKKYGEPGMFRRFHRKYFQWPSLHKRSQGDRQLIKYKKKGKVPFPFASLMNPFEDEIANDDFEDEEEEEGNENKRKKREMVEEISDGARDAVHDAVDGIFDNIMKGIIQAMKYRE